MPDGVQVCGRNRASRSPRGEALGRAGPGAADCSRGCRPEPELGGGAGVLDSARGRGDLRAAVIPGSRRAWGSRAPCCTRRPAGPGRHRFACLRDALRGAGPRLGSGEGWKRRLPASPARDPGGLPSLLGSEAHASLKGCPEAGAVSPPPVAPRSAALGGVGGRSRSRAEQMPPGAKASASPPAECAPCSPLPGPHLPGEEETPESPVWGGLGHWGCAWGASLQGEDPQEWPGATPLWEAPGPGGPSELTDEPPGGGPRHEQDAGGRGEGFRD